MRPPQRAATPLPPLALVGIGGRGPEDVVVDAAGRVLTGTDDGRILRITLPAPGASARTEEIARTGGRPLGLDVLADVRLLVCDAERGLLRIAPGSAGPPEVLAGAVRFCSNAASVRARRHGPGRGSDTGSYPAALLKSCSTGCISPTASSCPPTSRMWRSPRPAPTA
ncbi:hypothetical protein [Streptomyces sp. NPDC001415]